MYQTAYRHIVAFRPRLQFYEIDLAFFFAFTKYLYDKEFSQNHVRKIIGTLKTFLNDATERGFNKTLHYKSRSFSVSKFDTYKVFLTEEELEKIYKAEMPSYTNLDQARDFLLLLCWTGVRYSDLHQIREEHIYEEDGSQYLEICKQTKTKHPVVLPLHPVVQAILRKYDYKLPRIISNQKLNVRVKDVCRIAGINTRMIIPKDKGGKQLDVKVQKWEEVATHTGRRSLICNLFLAGYNLETIKKFVGQRDVKSTIEYLHLTNKYHAKLASKFFKNAKPLKAI